MSRGPGAPWNGRRSAEASRRVIARDNGICWLCGQPGADQADHVLPRRDFPEYAWYAPNIRAAHARCNYQRNGRNGSRYNAPDWVAYLDEFGVPAGHPSVVRALATLGATVPATPVWRPEPVPAAPPAPVPAARPSWTVV